MAHTPGPWWVEGPGEGIEVHDIFGRTASVWGGAEAGDEAWANARLIAAAPELYEALSLCAARWDKYDDEDDPELGRLIETAIAKAEGRGDDNEV